MRPGIVKALPGVLELLEHSGDVLERGRYIARIYSVTLDALGSMSRAHPQTYARRDFWRYLYDERRWSSTGIAGVWRCDHTSVLTGMRAARQRNGEGWLPDYLVHGLQLQSSGDSRK